MISKTFFTGILALGLLSCSQTPIREYAIIPQPAEIAYQNGDIKLKAPLKIASPSALNKEATLLQEYLSKDFTLASSIEENKEKGDIILLLDPTYMPDKKEAYSLETKKNITIKANSEAGILNGIQSLRQIISKNNDELVAQKGTISDYPAFEWRAFMLDEGRYFKGKKVVLDLLDQMAYLKMNTFHWHLTEDQGWRIEIKKYPKLTEIGASRDSSEINNFNSDVYDGKTHSGFYTQDDIKEIVAYATARNITVVPEIEMPGHASAAIAAYPWLGTEGKQIKVPGKFGVHYNVYNVADPKVTAFLEDVMDEVIALFPGEVFHIGGDEVKYDYWKKSPAINSYMKKNNLSTPAELQVFFTNNISNILASKGKRMMGWNEITGSKLHEYQDEKDTEVDQKLAEGTVVHFWKGEPELVKETIEKGYDVVNSYHEYTYLDYPYESISLEKAYNFNPIPEGLTKEQEKHVLGLGCQMWGEFIPTVESMNLKIYPRIAAYAEAGWTQPGNKDFSRFQNAIPALYSKWDKEGIVPGI